MENRYYEALTLRHNLLDPRYIHSLPVHRFTHYGDKSIVDSYVFCDTLRIDMLRLAERLNWPERMKKKISDCLINENQAKALSECSISTIKYAEELYAEDFRIFNYNLVNKNKLTVIKKIKDAGVDDVFDAIINWALGPCRKKEERWRRYDESH